MQYRFDKIAFNSTAKKKPTEEDKEHYIGLEHLDSDCLSVTRWGTDVAPTGEKLLMKKGDVLFGKRRAYQRKVGIAPFDGIFSAHGMVLRPNEEVIDKDFFPFFISSDQFMERAVRISVGGLSPTINWKDLREQEFEIPSLSEQKKLSAQLWAAYRLKESYKKLLSATDEMVKSRFIEMFDQAPEVKLGDYITTQSGGTPNTKKTEYYEGGDIPWLSSGEVNQGYITSTEKFITQIGLDNSSAKWTPKDCVVIAMYGATAGKVGFVKIPLTTNQAVCTLLPCDNFKPIFLYYAVSQKTDWMIFKCQGAAQPNISQGIIRSMELPLPSMDEQDKFVSIAEQADKSKFVGFKSRFIEMVGVPANSTKGKRGEELFTFSSGKANTKSNLDPSFQYNCYGGNGITGKSKDYLLKDKTIVIGRVGEYCGCVHKTTDYCWITDNAIYLKTYSDLYRFEFIYHMFTMMDFHRFASETGQPKITQAPLLSCHYPLPSLEEQNKFVAIAEQVDKSKYYYQIA